MDKIAIALKVLGHTERLRILALISRGELTVSELVKILGLSQPRVTQYIKSLEDADICLLYTSPSPRDQRGSRMPSSA